ncbi:hypothetical protein PRIPAC_79607 [Pristionchus pacificus]|uniref:Uncharacterized protein n=1 Tax=Pristionchus pacificus TaxID=54126 RepID=A0A2A6BXB7_PRIPA|nr:hypothetical protein PRIPAC_79607 [Pristionchus pacificus]|eukprot:PDM70550.1 hypothetical protein PRIPAC_46796 [Pristionchus pacificus]
MESKTSIEDLPVDILISIFKYHKHKTVLLMRLNKKMTQRVQSIFDCEQLWLKINDVDYQLSGTYWAYQYKKRDAYCIFNLQRKLRSWPERTVFRMIHISINVFDERIGDTLDQLFQLSTDRLVVDSKIHVALRQLNFANILQMAGNIREVSIEAICSLLTGMDLCIIWKAAAKWSLSSSNSDPVTFQISLEEDFRNHSFKFTCAADDPPTLFSDSAHYPRTLLHFAEDFVLQLDEHQISFTKIDAETKDGILQKFYQIKMNHLLPDVILLEMYKYFNIGKLRLNRRMKERIEAFKFNKIRLTVHKNEYYLTVSNTWIAEKKFDNENVDRLSEGLRAWTASYYTRQVEIEMLNIASFKRNELFVGPAIEALMEFNCDKLLVHGMEFIEEESEFSPGHSWKKEVLFPHPSFTTLLVMSANASDVQMTNLRCCEIEAISLAALHRNLVKGGCKLSSFAAKINPRAAQEFLKLCFGVVLLEDRHPNCHSKEYQFLHEPISMCLESFPDDVLLEMYNYFNIGKLRLNKRMKERIETFSFKKIHLKVQKREYYLNVSKTWLIEKKFENEGMWSANRLADGLRA